MKKKLEVKKVYNLSPMQEGMLFHHVMDNSSNAYFEQTTLTIKGNLKADLLEESFNVLIKRYDIFRTNFVYQGLKKPQQVVLSQRQLKLVFRDISNFSDNEKDEFVEDFKRKDRENKFDLAKDILIRMALIKIHSDEYKLIWSFHHVLMDGWCLGIILKELFFVYAALEEGKPFNLGETRQYENFIKWIDSQDCNEAAHYWEKYLDDYKVAVSLPHTKLLGDEKYSNEEFSIVLDEGISESFSQMSKKYQVTLNTLIHGIWGILLQRYNNTDDVVFGAVVSGRPPEIDGIENMVGLCINTNPVRIKCHGETRFLELINQIQESALNSEKYCYYPLADIQAKTEIKADLVDNIVVFGNYPLGEKEEDTSASQGWSFTITGLEAFEETNYNLNVSILPGEKLTVKFEYNANLYDRKFIRQVGIHLKNIAKTVSQNQDIYIHEIDMLSKEEKNKILFDFNDTKIDYQKDKTIHQLFEEQVLKSPNNSAVVFENNKLTYSELNNKANQLAHVLREKGISREKVVAIMAGRSTEIIIAILAVLKAGGAYLPIDPEYPQDRIQYMLEDSEAGVLLIQEHMLDRINFKGEIIDITDESIYLSSRLNLDNINTPEDMAYIIYTSGSTGKPKGVVIRHKSVANLSAWFNNRFNLQENKNVIQMTDISFDVSVEEILLPILNSATVIIPKKETILNKEQFVEFIKANEINIAQFVPVTLKELLLENDKVESLKVVICGGDRMEKHLKDAILHKGYQLYNNYGPTEITVDALSARCEKKILTIGKPIANTRVYVLDKDNNLQPVGVPGELCIAGDGLAKGYLNRPELTKEKFVPDPFIYGEEMYRTGDLVKWMEDGNIDFLGRIDYQVKIRGYRIELGEIENEFLKIQYIKEAVVVDKLDSKGNKYLCAYVVMSKELSVSELREYLSSNLPEYMIPSYFVQVDKLPLTPNGKIDRKSLPEFDGNINTGVGYEAPTNETQQKLIAIWQDILGVQRVGVNDSFFDLGGHSLRATTLISRIRKELSVEVPLKEVFARKTIKNLAQYIHEQAITAFKGISPVKEREYYRVSSAQKRMYLINLMQRDNITYNIPSVIMIEGVLDRVKLETIFKKLIDRHESFRTSFEMMDGEPVQRIHKVVDFHINYVECEEIRVKELIKDLVKPFDLGKAPLLRGDIIKLNHDKHLFVCDMHHIISDGVSGNIFTKEFVALYNGQELPELKVQYKDYSEWQNEFLKSDNLKKQQDYWLEIFKEEIPVLSMPYDYPRPAVQNYEGDSISFDIGSDIGRGLTKIATKAEATMYMVLLAAYNILHSKYSNQEDIIVGTPIAGRQHVDLENVMGMFVNTLAIRNYSEGSMSFTEFLKEVKEKSLKAYEYQDCQFEDLIDKLNIKRDLSRNPLFDTMFVLQNTEMREAYIKGLSFKPYEYENNVSKLDMTLNAIEVENNIWFNLEYCTKLFKKETMERLKGHFINILSEIVKNPEKKLSEIDMLSDEERHQLVLDFNDTKTEASEKAVAIHQLFEEQVKKTPDNIAVAMGDMSLTYRELNEKSNQLAGVLRKKGIKAESVVGIMVERSLEMIIGIMGILKSGGAYLPIDQGYPEERINFMLRDSKAEVLLTQKHLSNKLSFEGAIVYLEDKGIYESEASNLERMSKPSDLAYIIYTSGTTGTPKGVMIEHGSFSETIQWRKQEYGLDHKDSVLQLFSFTFDGFVTSFFTPIISGSKVVLLKEDEAKDPMAIKRNLIKHRVTHFISVPMMYSALLDCMEKEDAKSLRIVTLAGDSVSSAVVEKSRQMNPELEIVNEYGPTESTVVTSMARNIQPDGITIGKPIAGTSVYILDKNSMLQPVGVPGELCISTTRLAREYLNSPELTQEKFVSNPFVSGSRMYRTGDLARRLPDGRIEFLGRIDHQVKIRGFRIEQGEIESQLMKIPSIKEAVVTDRMDINGSKYLCAYIVSHETIKVSDLREDLLKVLPDYMIPSYFMQIDKLPLMISGKVDKKALPEPDETISTGAKYQAPTNETEEKLAAIWQEVLGVQKVGINDSFFDLGGHSLKATTLVARIHKKLNIEVSLTEVFSRRTIKELAVYILGQNTSNFSGINAIEEREYYPVSSAQKRMYLVNMMQGDNITYNMPLSLVLEGSLDRAKLEETFQKLISRHESFRTSFEMLDGEPVQRIHKYVDFKVKYTECEELKAKDIIDEFVKPFDLGKAPLLKTELIKLAEGKYILLCDMHHIICDGTSVSIFMNEIASSYNGQELPELRVQYKDFSVWQNELLRSDELKRQEQCWFEIFKGEIPVLSMPYDYPRPAVQNYEGDSISFDVSSDIGRGLTKIGTKAEATMYMVLLAAYNFLLSKYSNQEDIIVGTPIAGRQHTDLENIMGMFANTLTMRNFPESRKSFNQFLAEVRENALKAYENQDFQFEVLIEKIDVKRDLSHNPLFDTMFVMQNTKKTEASMEGLRLRTLGHEIKISKFDITLNAAEIENKLWFNLEYCTKLFKKETMERLKGHFINILSEIVKNPEIKLSEIDMLSEEERHQLLDFNDTKAEATEGAIAIHQLFEEQANKTPDNIAVALGDMSLTYRELNEKSNQLSGVLRKKGIKAESVVGIMVERSLEMIIGIMGILKSGGAYLPIDQGYPEERINFMLRDSKAEVLLTQKHLSNKLSFEGAIVYVEDKGIYESEASNLERMSKPSDLAYIIYTSGTTGTPKGVMIEHGSFSETIQWRKREYGLDHKDSVLQLFSFTFDGFVTSFFTPIISGSKVVLLKEDEAKDPMAIKRNLIKHGVTHFISVPMLYSALLDCMEKEDAKSLRIVTLAGDSVSSAVVEKSRQMNAELEIVNEYGPTESTVVTSMARNIQPDGITIGKPIAGTSVYILDKNSMLQPVGVPGELCISTTRLAREYLNSPELTQEKFVSNPFVSGNRMYRTGDLARRLPDGKIEFLGRIDHQVKIRGFRIEQGEIESQLMKIPSIKEAVVTDRMDINGSKYLCAYIVSHETIKVSDLREDLLKVLPDYMIPSYFMQLDKLPLMISGKVDKKALPEPDETISTGAKYQAPTNETEEKLVAIWKEVLGVQKVGINDSFFDLGGDSIKAMQVLSRLHQLNLTVSMKDFFHNVTISQVEKYVKRTEKEVFQGIVTGEVELTPIQRWFFQKNHIAEQYFNQEIMIYRKDGFDENCIISVFTKIVEHHDALRIVFRREQDKTIQYNRGIKEELFTFEIIELTGLSEYVGKVKADADRIQASIDLEHGPLMKLVLFRTSQGDHLLIVTHHLVSDGVSWRIILEDFALGYEQAIRNTEIKLPDKTNSFLDWAQKLVKYANTKELLKELDYWIEGDKLGTTSIPKNNVSQGNKIKDGSSIQISLEISETELFLRSVNQAYNTDARDILLTALGLALRDWTGNTSIAVDIEGHGREDILEDIDVSRTVGWFTSIHPFVLDMKYAKDLSLQIKTIKEDLRHIPNKGVGYGILKYLTSGDKRRGLEFTLTPEISFNYLGQLDQEINNGSFGVSALPSGVAISPNNERSHAIEISGSIFCDKLNFSFNYNRFEFQDKNVAKLGVVFKQYLLEIIDHCVKKTSTEMTPSDVGDCDLTLEEFEQISNFYEV